MMFNIFDWYWLADDGRIYSSARQVQADTTDADYTAWTGNGGVATPWPSDKDGNQTDAALQEVLDPYGMFANLSYYAIDVRWQAEQQGITLTSGMPIKTDDRSQAKINGVRVEAAADDTFTTQWSAADYSIWSLTAADVIDMSTQLQAHIDAVFATGADVLTQIEGGTITTRAEVDAAFGITPARLGAPQARRPFPKKLRHQ